MRLGTRRIEVLRYVCLGKTNIEIGQIMGTSPLTVKNHVQKLLQQLGAENRTGLVWRAIEFGVIEPPAVREHIEPCWFPREEFVGPPCPDRRTLRKAHGRSRPVYNRAPPVEVEGVEIRLGRKTRPLFEAMSRRLGHLFTPRYVCDLIYEGRMPPTATLNATLQNLRRRLQPTPLRIVNEYGVGWRLIHT